MGQVEPFVLTKQDGEPVHFGKDDRPSVSTLYTRDALTSVRYSQPRWQNCKNESCRRSITVYPWIPII